MSYLPKLSTPIGSLHPPIKTCQSPLTPLYSVPRNKTRISLNYKCRESSNNGTFRNETKRFEWMRGWYHGVNRMVIDNGGYGRNIAGGRERGDNRKEKRN